MIIVTILMTYDWRVPKAKCGFTAMHACQYRLTEIIFTLLYVCHVP